MIWLIGCNGMLASELKRQLEKNNMPYVGTGLDVDITDYDALLKFAQCHNTSPAGTTSRDKISWIINCAAYTAVDKAEDEREQARLANEVGPTNIARVARIIGAKLIHISTDYVFDGKASSPYTENMPISPTGVYGTTKAAGEKAVQKEMTQYYILRTAWLYGFDGKNFVYTMTKLFGSKDEVKVVSDQKGTPTCCTTLAQVIISIIQTAQNAHKLFGPHAALPYDIYHVTDEGETTWYEFAKEIYRLARKYKKIDKECTITPCTTEEYGAKAPRPMYSVLSKKKIQTSLNIKLPKWKDSLEKFFKDNNFSIK